MKVIRSKSFLIGTSTIAILAIGVTTAEAQVADPAKNSEIAEIVVTARKTSEALQTTPVAVTALNAEDLRAAQITTVADLAKKSPALAVQTGASAPPCRVDAPAWDFRS